MRKQIVRDGAVIINNQKKIEAIDVIAYILLLLACVNINNMFFVLISVTLVFLFITNKITFPKATWSLYLFCFTFMIFYYYNKNYSLNDLLKAFSYGLSFSIGDILIRRRTNKIKAATNLILLISFGFCIHGCLNFFMNYLDYGWHPLTRNMPDIWTGKPMAATGHGVIFCVFVGSLYYCLFVQKKKWIMVLALIGLICMVLFNMMSASRTVFVLIALTFACSLALDIGTRKAITTKHLLIIAIIVFMIILFISNAFGIKSFFNESALGNRLKYVENIKEDSRFFIHKVYLVGMFYYPFGGRNIKRIIGTYAHNLFLDLYDMAGFIPTLCLLIFFIKMTIILLHIIKDNRVDLGFKLLYFSVNVTMIFQLFTEPILEGVPWLLAIYCLINGIGNRVYISIKEKNCGDPENENSAG